MLTKFEIIIYLYLIIHIILASLKYLKHHNFLLIEYIVGTDKAYKTILFSASLVSIISFAKLFRVYQTNIMYDVAGNSYTLRENKFYIYDGYCKYDIKNDTIYLGNIKIGYFKFKGDERIIHTDKEMKLFDTKPKNAHGKENLPLYQNVFITNAQILYKLRSNNKLNAIKSIERQNKLKSDIVWKIVNYRDSMDKVYNARIDSINKRIDNNQLIINSLEKQYANSK